MKLNEDLCLVSEKFTLVPYKHKHVKKYHEWMKNVELQEQTASEPLTLEKEYEMQKSWHEDEDKLTFIILNNEETNEIDRMIGDVNLFIADDEENTIKVGECEIMIAEKSHRGKGLAKPLMTTLIKYAENNNICSKFIARIGYENKPSQNLFQKLGFEEESRGECFKEITYSLTKPEMLPEVPIKEMIYSKNFE